MSIFSDKNYIESCPHYYLKPGYIYVSQEPTIVTTVLGSCVSVCIYDKVKKYGGMNHFIMAKNTKHDNPTSRYGSLSIPQLIKLFTNFGSKKDNLIAQIVGGAYLESSDGSKLVSKHNIEVSIKILTDYNIKIISQDTGGILGRKVIFVSEYNELMITKLSKIRTSDFYEEE